MEWLNKFRHWAEHPLYTFAVTVILAPLWLYLGWVYVVPFVGFIFGMIHEGLQYFFGVGHKEETFRWDDVLDFTTGGIIASGCIGGIVLLS